MSRASNLAGFSTSVVGTSPNNLIVGVVTATSFYGDGSNLDGITSAGLGTAVEAGSVFGGEQIYYTDTVLGIGGTVTVDPPSTTNVAYTQYVDISVEEGADLIIADGDDLVPDILGIGTDGITVLPGNGGRVRADNFTNKAGTGAPTFPNGAVVTGIITATTGSFSGNVSVGGTLTYEDVTNVDSIGIVTARSGVDITGGSLYLGDGQYGYFGDSNDLRIYHDGSNSYIDDNGDGNLYIRGGTGNVYIKQNTTEDGIILNQDGSVQLYYDNSQKLVTTGAGVSITGVCTATSYFDGRVPNIPQNAQGGAYTLVKSDAGKHINAGGNVTVNASIFDIGDAISVFNDTGGDITIIQGTSVTLRLVADTSTGTRTLANYGLACILCVGSNEFVVSGGGIS
jgi:hypothetical protein